MHQRCFNWSCILLVITVMCCIKLRCDLRPGKGVHVWDGIIHLCTCMCAMCMLAITAIVKTLSQSIKDAPWLAPDCWTTGASINLKRREFVMVWSYFLSPDRKFCSCSQMLFSSLSLSFVSSEAIWGHLKLLGDSANAVTHLLFWGYCFSTT